MNNRKCFYPIGTDETGYCIDRPTTETESGKTYCDYHYMKVMANRAFLQELFAEVKRPSPVINPFKIKEMNQ